MFDFSDFSLSQLSTPNRLSVYQTFGLFQFNGSFVLNREGFP